MPEGLRVQAQPVSAVDNEGACGKACRRAQSLL